MATSVLILFIVGVTKDLATGLLQVVLLVFGLWSSYALGQRNDLRPHVRKAYRRAVNLHGQLYALTERIAILRDNVNATDEHAVRDRACDALESIEFSVGQQ